MCYGLISSSSSFLSEIARNLNETITLKKTVERLSNRLGNFDEDNRNLVWDNYIDTVKDKIDDNTIWCVDPGDIGKKHSLKLENLDKIVDGSTGEIINGYRTIEIAGLTQKEKLPIPVYSKVYSSKEENFISEFDENETALKYIKDNFGSKGIYALDRGFDDKKYFKYFSDNELSFVIRMTKKRDVVAGRSKNPTNIKKVALRIKCTKQYNYKDKYGIIRTATTGYKKVIIPDIPDKIYYLVIIKSNEFPNNPMMLLTNLIPDSEEFTKLVNKVYIRRWKIEEYFRFKKQQFKFEKLLVRTLDSIRTMNMLLSIVIGFIGVFSDNQKQVQYMVVFKASKSLKTNEKITLVYYAIERGLNRIFNFNLKGIKNMYSTEKRKSEQCILPEFSDLKCFTY